MKRNWYLLQTRPRQEWIAQTNLTRQGYENYVPKLLNNVKYRGKYRDIIEPLFPGYLFINLDIESDNWSPIRSTLGVKDFVKFGGRHALVHANLIEQIKSNEDDSGLQKMPTKTFKKGVSVIISQGPLTGYEAIYESATSKGRVIVLLNVLSQEVRMQISKHDLLLA